MKIFIAGASGVIGVRLVPLLIEAGHVVAGLTRSPDKAAQLAALGAQPVVCNVFNGDALDEAVAGFGPDMIMHQLTDLPDDARMIPDYADANARIRREGTDNLLAAAHNNGVRGFMAQSIAWEIPGEGGAAARHLESAVLQAGGVVLRYGRFYGPGTYYETDLPAAPRIHIDEAARRTIARLGAPSGIEVIAE